MPVIRNYRLQDIQNRRFTEIVGPRDIYVPEKIDSSE